MMGRRKVLKVPPLTTLSSTLLTLAWREGFLWPVPWASGSSPTGDHEEALCLLPWCRGGSSATFYHCWRCRSASTKHPGGGRELQTFWLRIIAGVVRDGALTSVEMVVRGLALIKADILSMTIDRTLWERRDAPEILKTVREDIKRWTDLTLSLFGRSEVIKMNILPRLAFLVSSIPLKFLLSWFKGINKLFSGFLWNYKKPRISNTKLNNPRIKGGLGLPDIYQY